MVRRTRCLILALLVALLVLIPTAAALDTTEIDQVRKKQVLDTGDLQIIDNFLARATQELLNTEDFTSVARIRAFVVSRSSSDQVQYAEEFSASARRNLTAALQQAGRLSDVDRRGKVMLNLMILLDNLQNPQVSQLALSMADNQNAAIRYWAVHSVTNPDITKQLNSASSADAELLETIVDKLKERINVESSPEIIGLIVNFTVDLASPQAEELLLTIVDMRIQKYIAWTVDYELLDAAILRLLADRILSQASNKPDLIRCFARLYSYAIQRYIKGQEKNVLNPVRIQHLKSVLAETEKFSIGKLLGISQSTIKTAVEKNNYSALIAEHNSLLGTSTTLGRLAEKFNFDYGANPNSSRMTAPPILPDPPRVEDIR